MFLKTLQLTVVTCTRIDAYKHIDEDQRSRKLTLLPQKKIIPNLLSPEEEWIEFSSTSEVYYIAANFDFKLESNSLSYLIGGDAHQELM